MVFCGMSFWADTTCLNTTPVAPDAMQYTSVSYGVIDDFYITKDTDVEEIPSDWDVDTILMTDFDNGTVAGNMSWYLDSVQCILLRRRESGGDWITIYQQDIENIEDFNFIYNDYLCAAKRTYEYAIVPVYTDNKEGAMVSGWNQNDNTNTITATYEGITIVGDGVAYNTVVECGDTNTTRVQKVGIVELQNYNKPKVFVNSSISYDTGTVSGLFVKKDNESCSFDFDNAYTYRKEFIDFLTDGTVKFIKSWDGRAWLAAVSGEPTDKADGHHDARITEFQFTEVGDITSEKDLYRYGLINAEEQYWCQYYK